MKASDRLTGIISNIQRFSIHDGPGVRTTVFFKGCPLRCIWCHNPETWRFGQELRYKAADCAHCLSCVRACAKTTGALTAAENGLFYSPEKCAHCFNCVNECPTGALDIIGREMTIDDVLREVSFDRGMYERTGGGATLSGGEAGAQYEFCLALLKALRDKGIHTALDTCGECDTGHFANLIENTDLVLFDIKHTDGAMHKKLTGTDNRRILKNFDLLSDFCTPVEVRMPIIPGMNDGKDDIEAAAMLIKRNKAVKAVTLLGYHQLGQSKIYDFDKKGRDIGIRPPGNAHLGELAERISSISGLRVGYR